MTFRGSVLQFKPAAPPMTSLNSLLVGYVTRGDTTLLTSPLVVPLISPLSGGMLCWRPEGLGVLPACRAVGTGWGTAAGCM